MSCRLYCRVFLSLNVKPARLYITYMFFLFSRGMIVILRLVGGGLSCRLVC